MKKNVPRLYAMGRLLMVSKLMVERYDHTSDYLNLDSIYVTYLEACSKCFSGFIYKLSDQGRPTSFHCCRWMSHHHLRVILGPQNPKKI